MRSDIAAEARAKIVYERLINVTADPGVKDALGFLMTREIAHQKSFEKALYAITPNFPPGKLPGIPAFSDLYVNASQGEGDLKGPWNEGGEWKRLDAVEANLPLDGGDGRASVGLPRPEQADLASFAARTESHRQADPKTDVDLGNGGAERRNRRGSPRQHPV